MPDPDGVYSSLLGTANMNKCHVNIPNIWDGNGTLIPPAEYDNKLESGMVVMVNIYMKL